MIAVIQGLETAEARYGLAREILTLYNQRLHRNELVLGPVRGIALENITGSTTQCVDKITAIYRSCKAGSDSSKKVIDAGLDFLRGLPLLESVHGSRVFFKDIARVHDADSEDMLRKVAPNLLGAFAFATDCAEKIENPELASKAARQLLGDAGWLSYSDINDRRQQMARLNILVRDEDRPTPDSQEKVALDRPGLDML